MGSFGKVYSAEGNPRTTAILAVAKANDLDVELVKVELGKPTKEHLAVNKLGKIPAFGGADGFVLTECIAICVYLASQNEKTTLLGATKQDYASILKWMSFFNSEVISNLGNWFMPLVGRKEYNKKEVDNAIKSTENVISIVEEHLQEHTYLVSERVTLADIFGVSMCARGFQYLFDKDWRSKHPAFTRWYTTVYNQPIYSAVVPELKLIDTAVPNPPKKTDQPQDAKKDGAKGATAGAAAGAAGAAGAGAGAGAGAEEEPKEVKAKHPLEALPKSSFPLDEWKRHYSNNETKEALKWFWENVPMNEYSIWKVRYKYNDELTMTFMSNNLIGGFNNRLEASRKYLFGAMCVFGENNDSAIEGAFVIRGDDYLPVFDVAPDYESYEFVKLDPKKEEDKKIVESHWSDTPDPIKVKGKEYKYAPSTGKVFK